MMNDEDFGIWYVDASDQPDRYVGKKIHFRGMVFKPKQYGKNAFVPGRFAMTCCVEDITFVGFKCYYDGSKNLIDRQWVDVTATIKKEYYPDFEGDGPVGRAIAENSATMQNVIMTLSFLMGLVIDIFSNTPGMYALASVSVAFVRRTFIALVLQRGNEEVSLVPSFRSFGSGYFSIYAFCVIFLFCILVFIIEAFSFFTPLILVLRILSSTLLTFILILALESLNWKKK